MGAVMKIPKVSRVRSPGFWWSRRTVRRMALLCALAASSGMAQAASWNGWARCRVEITGTGYNNIETHTWMVSNVRSNSPTDYGPGNWTQVGSGTANRGNSAQSEHVEWAINSSSADGRFVVQVNNGMATIRPVHAQLTQAHGITGYGQLTIAGSGPQRPALIDGTQWEYPFPVVTGNATGTTLQGTSSLPVNGAWGYQQASGSNAVANCEWNFANGSVPAPPPPVPVTPTPMPPAWPPVPTPPATAASRPWNGSIECNMSASLQTSYQETISHRWELLGKPPVASNGGYLHAVQWIAEGKGSSSDRREQRTWTTSVREPSSRFIFIRPTDGKMVIQPVQPPHVAVGAVKGTRQSLRAGVAMGSFTADVAEPAQPEIVADPNYQTFKARYSQPLGGGISGMTPAGATGGAKCNWLLRPAGAP